MRHASKGLYFIRVEEDVKFFKSDIAGYPEVITKKRKWGLNQNAVPTFLELILTAYTARLISFGLI